jgi:hypothetical protein
MVGEKASCDTAEHAAKEAQAAHTTGAAVK